MTYFLKSNTMAIKFHFTSCVGVLFHCLLFYNRLVSFLYHDEYLKIKGQSSTWYAIISYRFYILMDAFG